MLVGVISAESIPADEQHVGLGLVEALAVSNIEWSITALGSPHGDSLCKVTESFALDHGFDWVPLPSMSLPDAVDNLLRTVDALLVVTDGISYEMAQYAELGRDYLGWARVHERVVKWKQTSLW